MKPNPLRDFEIDRDAIQYVGRDLQRPECILAEPDGTLWSADARGGVVRIALDGSQDVITQRRSAHFEHAGSEATRYLHGTLPNGLAFDKNGDFLISNFGTDCLEIMSRDGASRVLADTIDGAPIGKVNFVLRDSRDRIWITVSTRVKNWMHALRTDLPDGYLARFEGGRFRIVADGFQHSFTALFAVNSPVNRRKWPRGVLYWLALLRPIRTQAIGAPASTGSVPQTAAAADPRNGDSAAARPPQRCAAEPIQ